MKTKRKAIDLVAEKGRRRIAFEIETGKNSQKQIMENIQKCLNTGIDKVYIIAVKHNIFSKDSDLLD